MKFEVKTQNDDYFKSYVTLFIILGIISIIIILSNLSIKFGKISRHYEINHLCKILIIEKTSLNFKKLSKLTNQTSKQKIWEICREFVK